MTRQDPCGGDKRRRLNETERLLCAGSRSHTMGSGRHGIDLSADALFTRDSGWLADNTGKPESRRRGTEAMYPLNVAKC